MLQEKVLINIKYIIENELIVAISIPDDTT